MRFRDLPRFPCYPDKRPACGDWPKDASANPAQVAAMWNGRVGLLIAVPTGPPSGLAVLDVDLDGMEWLAVHRERLPPTREHVTRSGGRHLVYRHREGLRNSQSVIAPGVDVRAEGGYVVWWPSEGLSVERPDLLAEWPDWLFDAAMQGYRLQGKGDGYLPTDTAELPLVPTLKQEETLFRRFKQTVPRFSLEGTIGWSASNRAFQNVSNAPEGRRNHILNGEAYALGRIVVRGWLSGNLAVFALGEAAKACRYVRDHGEAATVAAIRHGLLDGMQNPYPDVTRRSREEVTTSLFKKEAEG